MQYLWNITLDDYMEAMKRAKANGKVAGDSMEEEFLEVMQEKNKKPFCGTELSREELMQEYLSKNKKPLSMETDKEGKTKFKFFEKRDEDAI